MTCKYKLLYFNFQALAESIRLLFAAAKVEFQDIRIDNDNWPQIKPLMPWNVLPVLELEDGKQLSESLTILRYLGRKFNLAGATEFETAKCDEYTYAMVDFRMEMVTGFILEEDETKKSIFIDTFQTEILPRICQQFSNILKENGTGFLVGERMTYADIYIVSMMEYLHDRLGLNIQNQLANFPHILSHRELIINTPGIKDYIAKRPQIPY